MVGRKIHFIAVLSESGISVAMHVVLEYSCMHAVSQEFAGALTIFFFPAKWKQVPSGPPQPQHWTHPVYVSDPVYPLF